jgi:hypothetical protein
MIHPQIHALPSVQKALTIADTTIALTQRIHQAVTSDRAIHIYRAIIKTTVTAMLLTIAAGMLTRQAVNTLYSLYDTHKDKDFAKLADNQIQQAVASVKVWVKGQRDRASILVRSTFKRVNTAARLKVAEVANTVIDRALPECPSGMCKVNLDEV